MNSVEIEEEQVWRKRGPYDWLRIEQILELGRTGYDGGLPGCVVTCFPPQLEGVKLRDGVRLFVAGDWRAHVRDNRYILSDGWKGGDSL